MADATITNIRSLMSEAQVAVSSSDYATARNKALQAKLLLSAIPDTERDGTVTHWREDINTLLRELERAQAGAATVQVCKFTQTRPSTT